jgi:hypothetical protein
MPDRRVALGRRPSRTRRDPTRRPCVYRPRVGRPGGRAGPAPELLTDLPAAALGLGPPRPTLNHVNAWITFPHAIIADLQQRGDVLAVWP